VENQRAVTLLFIVGGILVGVFMHSLVLGVSGYAAIEDYTLLGFVQVSVLVSIAAGIGAFLFGMRNPTASGFIDSVVTELLHVTWPDREETTRNTAVVVGAAVFFAALLACYDFAWAKITGLFLYTMG
jgi:preprotein translocase SecE subunit